MTVTRAAHCVYDTHYHLVFPVKYRKALLSQEVVRILFEVLHDIEERYDLTIEQAGDDKNHIHVLISFHPKYSIGQIVRILKSLSARQLFLRLPALKKELWGGEFWTDGYYVATVGTGGNWDVVEHYVRNQGKNNKDLQLSLWS
jgi:putative transposase